MRIPFIKAQDKDTGRWYKGFYFEYPRTTYCFENENRQEEKVYCLVTYKTTDWGLPNEPVLIENIDINSIEVLDYKDI